MDKYHKRFVQLTKLIVKKRRRNVLFRLIKKTGRDIVFRYDQIPDALRSTANMLKQAGISAGCRVAVISEHSPYALLTDLLLAYIGIKPVLIDASLPVEEIRKMLSDADVSGMIVSHDKYNDFFTNSTFDVPAFMIEPDFTYSHIQSSPK